jgi:hypothetical protein
MSRVGVGGEFTRALRPVFLFQGRNLTALNSYLLPTGDVSFTAKKQDYL